MQLPLRLRLDDAELATASLHGGPLGRQLRLRFSAVAAWPLHTAADADAGADAPSAKTPGHALGVVLELAGLRSPLPSPEALNELLGRVSQLDLRLDDQPTPHLTLPSAGAQAWQLQLHMANGGQLNAAGSGWQLLQPGGPRWQAYLHC